RSQHLQRLTPFVALQAEQDRSLVRKVLIERSDTDARLLRHACGGESLGTFTGQNLNSRLQNRRNEFAGTRLLRLFSQGNTGLLPTRHGALRNANSECDELFVFCGCAQAPHRLATWRPE